MERIEIKIKKVSYKILIAKDLQDWKEGLKGNKLDSCDGLLMVFPDKRPINITMTDMLYDLDIFWIDNNGYILKVLKKEPKGKEGEPYTKILGVECQYLLEINSTKNVSDFLVVGSKINIGSYF